MVAREINLTSVTMMWLALLVRIRQVPSEDFGSEATYPESDISRFPSVPPDKFRDSNLK
jgi:hypothetical protein